jgi:hypothetical protein
LAYNITPAGALALTATCEERLANSLGNFLHRHLGQKHMFSASTVRTSSLIRFYSR